MATVNVGGGPEWRPGLFGFRRLERGEKAEETPPPAPQPHEETLGKSELAKLTSGPKPSRAKTIYGFFYRVLNFLGLKGEKIGADLLHAIHSDESLTGYYQKPLPKLKILTPSKTLKFLTHFFERAEKKGTGVSKQFLESMKEARKWADKIEDFKINLKVRESSLRKKRQAWDKVDELTQKIPQVEQMRVELRNLKAELAEKERLMNVEKQKNKANEADQSITDQVRERRDYDSRVTQGRLRADIHDLKDQLKNHKTDAQYQKDIEQLKQTIEDLKKDKVDTIEGRRQTILKLSGSMTERIGNLKEGEKVIFPYSTDPADIQWKLVQIEKKAGDSFTLEIIGISADLAQYEAKVLGKEKKEKIAVYEGIQARNFDENFWKAVLVGQIPGAVTEIEEEVKKAYGDSLELEDILTTVGINRSDRPIESIQAYGRARGASTAMKTLQTFLKVNATSLGGPGSERARIAMGLSALREFYFSAYHSMVNNGTQRMLVEKAIGNLRRQADKYYSEGKITEADLRDLNHDLKKMDGRLQELASVRAAKKPLHKSLPKRLMTYHFGKIKGHSLPKTVSVGAAPTASPPYAGVQITPDELDAIKVGKEVKYLEGLAPAQIPGKLAELRSNALNLYKQGKFDAMSTLVTQIFKELPLVTLNTKDLKDINPLVFDTAKEIKQKGVWNKIKPFIDKPDSLLLSDITNLQLARELRKLSPQERAECLNAWKWVTDYPLSGYTIASLNERQLAKIKVAYQNRNMDPAEFAAAQGLLLEEARFLLEAVNGLDGVDPDEIQDKVNKISKLPGSVLSVFSMASRPSAEKIDLLGQLSGLTAAEFSSLNDAVRVVSFGRATFAELDAIVAKDPDWFKHARGTSTWEALTEDQRSEMSQEISRLQQILTDGIIKTQTTPERELLILKSAVLQDHLYRLTSVEYDRLAPGHLQARLRSLKEQMDPERLQTSDLYQNREWRSLANEIIAYGDQYRLQEKTALDSPTEEHEIELYAKLLTPDFNYNDMPAFKAELYKLKRDQALLDTKRGSLQVMIDLADERMVAPSRREYSSRKYEYDQENSKLDQLKIELANYTRYEAQTKDDQPESKKIWRDAINTAQAEILQLTPVVQHLKEEKDKLHPIYAKHDKEFEEAVRHLRKEISTIQEQKNELGKQEATAANRINTMNRNIEFMAQNMNPVTKFAKARGKDKLWMAGVKAIPLLMQSKEIRVPSQLQDLRVAELVLDTEKGLGGADRNFATYLENEYPGMKGTFLKKELNNSGEYNLNSVKRGNQGHFLGNMPEYKEGFFMMDASTREARENNHLWGWAWSQPAGGNLSKPSATYKLFSKKISEVGGDSMNEYSIPSTHYQYSDLFYADSEFRKLEGTEAFSQFLASLNKPGAAPQDLMRVLKRYPELMDNASMRSLVEAVLLQRNLMKEHIETNPRFFDDICTWIHEGLNESPVERRPGAHAAYLRMGVIFQGIVNDFQQDKPLKNVSEDQLKKVNEFQVLLENTLDDATTAESLKPFLKTLWMTRLDKYTEKVSFNGKELMEIARGMAVIQNGPDDPQGIHRLMHVRFGELIARTRPLLQQVAKDNEGFRNTLLDQMSKEIFSARGSGEWKGSWPRFQNDQIFVDLSRGTVATMAKAGKTVEFPENLLPMKSDMFEERAALAIIRDWGIPPTAELKTEKDESIYSFKLKNIPDRQFHLSMNTGTGDLHVYQEFKKGKESRAYELIPAKDFLFPPGSEKKEEPGLGGNQSLAKKAVAFVKMIWGKENKENPIPSFLAKDGLTFWKNPESPEVLVVNSKGEALYRTTLDSKGRVETFEDLNAKEPRVESVRCAIDTKHPVMKQICQFEDSEFVELYGHKNDLVRINLPRYDLNFKFENGKWACFGPEGSQLNGDFYLVEQPTIDQRRGLPNVLVLQDDKGNQRFINPKLEIVPPMTDPMKFMMKMLKKELWNLVSGFAKNKIYEILFNKDKRTLSLSDPSSLLQTELKHPDGKQSFQVFAQDQLTGTTRHIGGNSTKVMDHNEAYFELVQQALLCKEPLHALTFLKQMKSPLSPQVVGKIVAMSQICEQSPQLFTPNERALVLKALLQFSDMISMFSGSAQMGLATIDVGQYYQTMLGNYAFFLANHNRIKGELKLSVEEHRFLLAIANRVNPKFTAQHGGMIKDLMRAEELKRTESRKLSERLVELSKGPSTTVMAKASQQFLEMLSAPPGDSNRRLEMWEETREALKEAALSTYGEEKNFFVTLDRFAEYAMEGSDADELFQEHRLPTLAEVRAKAPGLPTPDEHGDPEKYEADLKTALEVYFSFLVTEKVEKWHLDPIKVVKATNTSIEEDMKNTLISNDLVDDLNKLADYQTLAPNAETLLNSIKKNDELRAERDRPFSVKKPTAALNVKFKALCQNKDKYLSYENPKNLTETDTMIDNLTKLSESTTEPNSVKEAAKELLASLNEAKRNHLTTSIPKLKADQINALRDDLKKQGDEYHKDAEHFKAAIEKQLVPKGLSPEQQKLHREGRIAASVDFEDVIKAFLQDDMPSLKMKLHPGVNLDELADGVRFYLLNATMEQRVKRCEGSLKTYETTMKNDPDDKAGVASAAVYALQTDLLGERQYDPLTHPEFMIFELKADILIRPNQLPVLEALVQDPNSVKQAVTGIGKTSVILLLVALLKAKPGQMSMLYFPRELFEDNTEQLQLKLGAFFERNVYELRYPPSKEQMEALGLPSEKILEKPWELSPAEKDGNDFLILNAIYERLVKTTADKGVVTSTKEAALGLQSQYKAYLKIMSQDPKSMTQIQIANMVQLSKILMFMRSYGVQLTDEVDRICDVRDKFLRAKQSENKIAKFKSDAVLKVYDALLEVESAAAPAEKTYVLENGQQDIKPEVRQKAIEKTAELLVAKFAKEGFIADDDIILNYMLGRENADFELLNSPEFAAWPDEQKDALKIMQEEISGILGSALSAKGGIRYGQCTEPRKAHEVVPYRLGLPRNNARQGLELEVLSFTVQHYYQNGPSDEQVEKWLKVISTQANKELAIFKKANKAPDINATKSANRFKAFFYEEGKEDPDFALGKYLGEDGGKRLIADLKAVPLGDPRRLHFIRKFLSEEVLVKLKASPSSTQDDASGFLSMHKANSGASATIGGLMGIKALNTETAEDPEALGRMMMLFLENGKINCKEYDPHNPMSLTDVIPQSADNEVFIDGAGVFAGLPGKEQALSLLENLNGTKDAPGPHPEIKGVVFWDDDGSKKVIMKDEKGKERVCTVAESGLKKHELGMYCDFARSRGADQPLGTRVVGTVTVNEVMDLDGLAQAKGRMRGEAQGQGTQAMVPQASGMKTKHDVVQASLRKKAELVEENLVRRINAEMRNEVHDAMMEKLLLISSSLLDGANPRAASVDQMGANVVNRLGLLNNLYNTYARFDILGSEEEKEGNPGEYFDKNKELRKKEDTLVVLERNRARYLDVAKKCNLTGVNGALLNAILSDGSIEKALKPFIPDNKKDAFVEVAEKFDAPPDERNIGFVDVAQLMMLTGCSKDILALYQNKGEWLSEDGHKRAAEMSDPGQGLEGIKSEWETDKWKNTIGARLPKQYISGSDNADQAQELEAEAEMEAELEQEQEQEQHLAQENVQEMLAFGMHPSWKNWPMGGKPIERLIRKAWSKPDVTQHWSHEAEVWDLKRLGGDDMNGFFNGILVNNNVMEDPVDAWPAGRFMKLRKSVPAVLVVQNGPETKVLGLDALDRDEVSRLLQQDREAGEKFPGVKAYLYDLDPNRNKVIATGANDEDIPLTGMPVEIRREVLKLKLYNLEFNYKPDELADIEQMFRETFSSPLDFLQFKDYFEKRVVPLRESGNIYYHVGNLKELMEKMEKEIKTTFGIS